MEILVGSTGFVGSNLKAKHHFDLLCNSKNIEEAYFKNPDLLVYAGIPAQKFIANQNEEQDLKVIQEAISNIQKINPKKLVLISTIDVFSNSDGLDEDDVSCFEKEEAYGKNRRILEEWVIENIKDYLIVRLPGLYGKNIKKNFIYDLIHLFPSLLKEDKLSSLAKTSPDIQRFYEQGQNGFYKIKDLNNKDQQRLKEILKEVKFSALNFTDSRGTFQFYNLAYLWEHIEIAMHHHLKILHLATEPITISTLYNYLYHEPFVNELDKAVPYYNLKTKYTSIFQGKDGYIFDKEFLLEDIKKFIENEEQPKLKLAISNIAWDKDLDDKMYQTLYQFGIKGLEIAPTRIVSMDPYLEAQTKKAKEILEQVQTKYHLSVVSMQSIWYGHQENIFESQENYELLKDYTKQAILYAEEIGCKNLVFGCPRNRNMSDKEKDFSVAVQFFNEIGDFASEHHVAIALEPNPPIYHTNFLNTTASAIEFVKALKTKGVLINYDLGTVIENQEDLAILKENINYIHHIHISEPNLVKIKPRKLHQELFSLLKSLHYDGYVSIEMGKQEDIKEIMDVLEYVTQTIEVS